MKKAQLQIITTVLIILLVLAGIIIVWQVVSEFIKPEFNITKRDCYIEHNDVKDSHCSLGCLFALESIYNQEIYLEGINRTLFQKDCYEYCKKEASSIEFCKPVKVNEIYVERKLKGFIEKQFKEQWEENGYICFDDEKDKRMIRCYEEEVKIPEDDLSINWLDKNAECIVNEDICKVYDTKKQCEDDTYNGCCVTKEYDCDKYKYKNYTIEVIK